MRHGSISGLPGLIRLRGFYTVNDERGNQSRSRAMVQYGLDHIAGNNSALAPLGAPLKTSPQRLRLLAAALKDRRVPLWHWFAQPSPLVGRLGRSPPDPCAVGGLPPSATARARSPPATAATCNGGGSAARRVEPGASSSLWACAEGPAALSTAADRDIAPSFT